MGVIRSLVDRRKAETTILSQDLAIGGNESKVIQDKRKVESTTAMIKDDLTDFLQSYGGGIGYSNADIDDWLAGKQH